MIMNDMTDRDELYEYRNAIQGHDTDSWCTAVDAVLCGYQTHSHKVTVILEQHYSAQDSPYHPAGNFTQNHPQCL